MEQKLNKQQFELIQKAPLYSKDKKFNGHPGVYGLFKKWVWKEECPSYIGFTLDLYRRCILDHRKPSQFLAERIVFDITGKRKDEFETYDEYMAIATSLLDTYEFRVIEECWPDEGRYKESTLLQIYKPKFNKRHW